VLFRSFVVTYKTKYKEEPSYIAMLGYLSAKYMLQAIDQGGGKSGNYGPEKTRAVLRATDTVGSLGRVAFDDKGEPKYFTAILFQTHKGNQVVVYPKDRAMGTIQYPAVPWGGK
jgi:branched-chain amino acid transport system substrate-binding protein